MSAQEKIAMKVSTSYLNQMLGAKTHEEIDDIFDRWKSHYTSLPEGVKPTMGEGIMKYYHGIPTVDWSSKDGVADHIRQHFVSSLQTLWMLHLEAGNLINNARKFRNQSYVLFIVWEYFSPSSSASQVPSLKIIAIMRDLAARCIFDQNIKEKEIKLGVVFDMIGYITGWMASELKNVTGGAKIMAGVMERIYTAIIGCSEDAKIRFKQLRGRAKRALKKINQMIKKCEKKLSKSTSQEKRNELSAESFDLRFTCELLTRALQNTASNSTVPSEDKDDHDDTASSVATSTFTVDTSIRHYQERRVDKRLGGKEITHRDVQKARKLGDDGGFVPSYKQRWTVDVDNLRYVFAKDKKSIITVYPRWDA